jgi:hypothetical protein
VNKLFAFALLALAGVTAYAQPPVAPPPREAGKAAKKDEPKESPRMAR